VGQPNPGNDTPAQMSSCGGCVPIAFPSRLIFLVGQLQEGLSHKASSDVVHCSRHLGPAYFLFQLFECVLHTLSIGDVGTDSNSLSPCGLNLFDERLVVGWVSSEKCDRILLGKPSCHRRTA